MKIEKTKPRKGVSELPLVTKEIIVHLQGCSEEELVSTLKTTHVWRYGKCELYHWIDVLDRFDSILEEATEHEGIFNPDSTECIFMCPRLEDCQFKDKVVAVLNFTALLIEHSYARHIYNSTEHLCVLLACPDLDVILAVLNLFYVFSKRSNFISRLPQKQRAALNSYLEFLGETWGGRQSGFGLADCCKHTGTHLPNIASTVHIEYELPVPDCGIKVCGLAQQASYTGHVVLENVDKVPLSIPEQMKRATSEHKIPSLQQMRLLSRLRLALHFSSHSQRLQCVLARLQAVSILVYSVAPAEIVDPLIYDGFVEELVEVLEIKGEELMDIRAAVLRTLTAIIHLDRNPRLTSIIEATGASTYHGFLPSLVRECVSTFTSTDGPSSSSSSDVYPLSFATALFSFLYHLATYEASGDALVSSGIMESLLQVLKWKAFEPMNITLVTRAVRVIDLITNLDMTSFHSLGGWGHMLGRLEMEVEECRKEVPFVLSPVLRPRPPAVVGEEGGAETLQEMEEASVEEVPMEAEAAAPQLLAADLSVQQSAAEGDSTLMETGGGEEGPASPQCMPERAALIKSILNFLKKAIPDPLFSENIRNFVDSSLPRSLKHIVSNAEYYGPSIYLPATEVTTVFIFHEPSQLSALQDNGLPWVVLDSIITKQIPVTREVLASLPNILSALCLNARGLQVFVEAHPFDHLFSVLISHDYLPAMRKKKGADQIGDTASNLGIAMDELMRHQPTLRSSVISALIRLLEQLCEMGNGVVGGGGDKARGAREGMMKRKPSTATAGEEHMSSSDSENEEDDDDDDEDSPQPERGEGEQQERFQGDEAESRSDQPPLPLTEYVINVVHFVDTILSNNSTDDHIREFISQKGLTPLLQLLTLPALPLDFPTSTACCAITNTCRAMLNIAHPPELLQESLSQLSDLLQALQPFLESPEAALDSALLAENSPVAGPGGASKSPLATPLLHRLVAANAFMQLFIHLSKACQVGYNIESRALYVTHWSSELGGRVLQQLSRLYRALVWEGFILLAVAANEDKALKESQSQTGDGSGSQSTGVPIVSDSQDSRQSHSQSESSSQTPVFAAPQTVDSVTCNVSIATTTTSQGSSSTITAQQFTAPSIATTTATLTSPAPQSGTQSTLIQSLKQLTPLLAVTSRVGGALAELMSLLVKICTSPLQRQHRRAGHGLIAYSYQPPSEEAVAVCLEVTNLLVDSMCWNVPMPSACSPAMSSPIRDRLFRGMAFKMYALDFCELLLFDEHKQAYHMMHHAFDKKTALNAFISTFHAAFVILNQGSEDGSIFGSCVDFLEAWLSLAEKLVNAQAILESSHALPIPPPSQAGGKKLMFNPLFNPLAFVVHAQKSLLPCLQELWASPLLTTLSPKVVELLLSAVRHYYSGEKIIETKLADLKALSPPSAASGSSQSSQPAAGPPPPAPTAGGASGGDGGGGAAEILVPPVPPVPRVDPLFLQQLCDMGFSREQSEDALLNTGNDLSAAMEWVLAHPPSAAAEAVGLSEEEQILRAIALSLGQEAAEEKKEKEKEERKEREKKVEAVEEELKALDKAVLDEFSDSLLPRSIELVSSVSESIYCVCDLVAALSKRNGIEWRNKALERVKTLALDSVKFLIDQMESDGYSSQLSAKTDPAACQLHLLVLLMEEMPLACAETVCVPQLLSLCIRLLHVTQIHVCEHSFPTDATANPRWLSPLLLVLDLWEKTISLAKLHQPTTEGCQATWQWFDGQWCSYTPENLQHLENAYQNGESSARISSGRQRFVVQFGTMMQVSVENSTRRPVIRVVVQRKKSDAEAKATTGRVPPLGKPASEVLDCFQSVPREEAEIVIRCCTRLLSTPLHADTLHATLRLCLRLTRRPELAAIFVECGGPQGLLSLTHKSSFKGFASLVALLFRHCLDEGPLLRHAIEGVVRSVVSNPLFGKNEFRPNGVAGKDVHYVLRRLAPCACRNPELFTEVACDILRISSELPSWDAHLTARVPVSAVKCTPPVKLPLAPLNFSQQSLINLLIDHLCADSFEDSTVETGEEGAKGGEEEALPGVSFARMSTGGRMRMSTGGRWRRHGLYQQHGLPDFDDDVVSEDMNMESESAPASRQTSSSSSPSSEGPGRDAEGKEKNEKVTEKPLLSKAAVLRLMAELVETYPPCAKLIADSTRKIKIEGEAAKEMPVLAFIFDHLLPPSANSNTAVPPIAKLAKTFLQCLATSHYAPEAIAIMVNELKFSFSRALALPESPLKHLRVRALTGLMSQIMDTQNVYPRGTVNLTHFARLVVRKGFISDLARSVHFLNLNSSQITGTVNNILKPLEVLTKIVNIASSQHKKQAKARENKPITLTSLPSTLPSSTLLNSATGGPPQQQLPSSDQPLAGPQVPAATSSAPQEAGGEVEKDSADAGLDQSADEALLEATHESLIPLEEEEAELQEEEEGHGGVSVSGFLEEVVGLAHELGRQHARDGGVDMDIEDMAAADFDDSHNMSDSEDSSGESLSESEEEEIEDNCNSAGEELEEEEYDESQGDLHNIAVEVDLSEPESSQDTEIEEEDEEEEDGEDLDVPTSADEEEEEEEEEESIVLDGDEGEGEGEGEGVDGGGGEFDGEYEGGEEGMEGDIEEDEDEDEEEEELDLEYDYEDEEDNVADYIQVNMPPMSWPWRFPSLLTRSYHTRPMQQFADFDQQSTENTLPQYHPLLTRQSDQQQQQQPARGLRVGVAPAQQEVSSAVQQLLTSISAITGANEVIGFGVGGAGAQRTRGSQGAQAQPMDDGTESTTIPSSQARMEEESVALDGLASHLCIAALRIEICSKLTEQYRRQNASKVSTTTTKKETTSSSVVPRTQEQRRGEVEASLSVPPVPHPSDIPTPASPRDQSSTVDELRSSLRQVADALAQTVAAVRSTRQQLVDRPAEEGGTEEGEGGGEERSQDAGEHEAGEGEEVQMDTFDIPNINRSGLSAEAQALAEVQVSFLPTFSAILPSTSLYPRPSVAQAPTPPPVTTTSAPPSLPILSTFDGSQESARATLASTDPEDPLYTFLQAVAGAPAPPLPETSSSSLSPISTATEVLSSPRLPVFTQFQSGSGTTSQPTPPPPVETPPSTVAAIHVPVIQDSRNLASTGIATTAIATTATTTTTASTDVAPSSQPPAALESQTLSTATAEVSSLAADLASQVSSFFGQSSPLQASASPSDGGQASSEPSIVQTANLADSLAQELVRAVSQMVPATSSTQQSESSPLSGITYSTASAASAASLSTRTSQGGTSASMQSPSPSDTLAPLLLQSLQMHSSTSAAGSETTPSVPVASERPGEERESLAEFLSLQQVPTVSSQQVVVTTGSSAATSSNGRDSDRTNEATAGSTMSKSSERSPEPSTQTEGGSSTQATIHVESPVVSMETTSSDVAPSAAPSGSAGAVASGGPAEDIDPEVLAALPESIRQEVLAQHQREQVARRVQQEAFQSSISPEFLAALPPNIQEEVLQQERAERARQQSEQGNPADPMDNASFFHNLSSDLRRTILADMDESMINHLPEEIASEARALRQERESRRRQMLEQRQAFMERMFEQAQMRAEGQPNWSHNMNVDPAMYRYGVLSLNPQFRHHYHQHHHGLRPGVHHFGNVLLSQQKGDMGSKQMLDQEALTCLLVLLFLDQNKLNGSKLHRILKNLSQHVPTRSWVLSSLLSIIRETSLSGVSRIGATCPMPPPLTPKHGSSSSVSAVVTSTPVSHHSHTPHWLNLSINAALGSHSGVFQFEHSGKIGVSSKVHIHPLACVNVCSNVLDLLLFFTRHYTGCLLPSELMPRDKGKEKAGGAGESEAEEKDEPSEVVTNFWQILMRLDGAASRKGKSSMKVFQYQDLDSSRPDYEVFSNSLAGQLMALLRHDVLNSSIGLMDKILKGLSITSNHIPKSGLSRRHRPKPGKTGNLEASSSQSTQAQSKPPSTGATDAAPSSEDVFPPESDVQVSIVEPHLLKAIADVLTSGQCSEDGLEDATNLLTNLSRCSVATREAILIMLLDGVRTIGQTLCSQIVVLLDDLRCNMASLKARRASSAPSQESQRPKVGSLEVASNVIPGIVLPRVSETHTDHSNDLHLPSMEQLTCKGSQQSFFLRMLKVVCQLRESAQAVLQQQQQSSQSRPSTQASQASSSERSESATGRDSERPPEQPTSSQSQPGPSSSASQEGTRKPREEDTRAAAHSTHFILQPLSLQLELEELWITLSECLDALAETQDPHAVLVLQSTVEAFFLVHAERTEDGKLSSKKSQSRSRVGRLSSFHTISDTESTPGSPAPHTAFSPMPGTPGPSEQEYDHLPPDTARFLKFAEKHRTVLNQILRQSTVPLTEGPFSVLKSHTRILDFDIKRRYFRQELEQMDEGLRRDDIILHIRRDHVFEDSFRELYRRTPDELKGNLYVQFEGEEGQDAGGLLREWYLIIAREMFNPNYALFKTTPGDRVTYMPNPSSNVNPNHLNYFKFTGRVIAKAIYDNKLLECYFTRSFYKHILGKPVHYTDMEAEDYSFYQGMVFLLEHDLNEIGTELSFSIEVQEFGKTETKELKPDGANIAVTEANKREYVQLACQMKMTVSIRAQIKSFLDGFYEIIPKEFISIFNEQELELLISGLPNIDIDDLKANTEYHKYNEGSLQVQWFWRALRSFDQADRARFLQFITGTSKVPLQGFAALEGMNGVQKFQIHRDDRSTDRLPCAHTCFNQLDLPPYETHDKLKKMLLTCVRECPEGFGFA